jgi:hypothetical protein
VSVIWGGAFRQPEWLREVLTRAVLVLVAGVLVVATTLPVSGFWLLLGAVWAAVLLVRAMTWVIERGDRDS